MIAFAADQGTIDHVAQWARTLDTRRKDSIEEAVFTYEVRNTQAEELTGTLNMMLGAGPIAIPRPEAGEGQEDEGARRGARGSLRGPGRPGPGSSSTRTAISCSSAAPARSGRSFAR